MKIGIAIITHNSKKHLPFCLPPLINSPLKPRILVVNSSSHDGTVELAEKMGVETLVIERNKFNHGLTRETARKYLNTEIIVMMTPDAYMVSSASLTKLIEPIIEGKASLSYARQLPHIGAKFFESFAREFNYPEEGHIRSIKDVPKYGVYTYFCSNSCAAYLNKALDEIGGFEEVLLGEDTIVAAKLLQRGHQIAYVSEALIRHSHNYNLKEEFCRNFDIGLARRKYSHLLKSEKGDYSRGMKYCMAMFKVLALEKPYLIPYAFLQTFTKYLGYSLGKLMLNASDTYKKWFSSQDFYWNSIYRNESKNE